MNFHIFGKGFGLYGYLPAIIKGKFNKIFVSKKYYSFIKRRKDLKKYIKYLEFVKNHFYKKNDFVIIAKRPSDQSKLIKRINNKSLHFFLEKPLGINYIKSKELLKFLVEKKINFSIAYLFLYTTWFSKLQSIVRSQDIKQIYLEWNFHSVNSSKHWKNKINNGGGLINFYGIHVIALMAYLKFLNCSKSFIKKNNNLENIWYAEFKNKTKIKFIVKINMRSLKNCFYISYLRKQNSNRFIKIYKNSNPFGKERTNLIDHRVKTLKKYLTNPMKFKRRGFYLNTLNLWKNVSKLNKNANINKSSFLKFKHYL